MLVQKYTFYKAVGNQDKFKTALSRWKKLLLWAVSSGKDVGLIYTLLHSGNFFGGGNPEK
ncbi:hypothetical protein [Calothrix sp. PCC 6303]|uniref:hypothetical protein n=1 Tax=Calothrix sp. PCC 6303 TaxID=1170562 RepID=UPI000317D81D